MITTKNFPVVVLAVALFLGQIAALRAGAQSPGNASLGHNIQPGSVMNYQPGDSAEPLRQLEEEVRKAIADPVVRKQIEPMLIQLLGRNSSLEAKRFACCQLSFLGSEAALPALAALFDTKETASLACLALTSYPPGKADKLLRAALRTTSGSTQIQIIHTLGNRQDTGSLKQLTALAMGSTPETAQAAVAAIGKMPNRSAVRALDKIDQSAGPALKTPIMEARLRQAGQMASAGNLKPALEIYSSMLANQSLPVYVRRAALDAQLRLEESKAEQQIKAILQGSDMALKPVAIAAVASLPSADASREFGSRFNQLSPEEQTWMIASLATRGDAPAKQVIASQFSSPHSAVRLAAFEALGRIGGAPEVPAFVRALAQAPADDRKAIETALVSLKGPPAIDRTIQSELNNSSGAARATLVEVLARRLGPAANPLLVAEAGNSDPTVANAAYKALRRTATAGEAIQLVANLTGPLSPEVRAEAEAAASEALGKVEIPARRTLLVKQAFESSSSMDSRISLLGLFAVCGDANGASVLRSALTDPESRIRAAAVRTLADWPDAAVWEDLCGIYFNPGDENLRSGALRGLTRLAAEANAKPDATLIQRYRDLLGKARNDADRKLILGALGGAAHPDALQVALPCLENAAIQPEAEAAVRRIAEAIKPQYPQAAEEALKKLTTAK